MSEDPDWEQDSPPADAVMINPSFLGVAVISPLSGGVPQVSFTFKADAGPPVYVLMSADQADETSRALRKCAGAVRSIEMQKGDDQ